MEVVSLWNLLEGAHVVLEVLVNILGGELLLVQDAVSIVGLMGIGLGTAKLGTGRISAIAVVKEVILRGTARTLPRI